MKRSISHTLSRLLSSSSLSMNMLLGAWKSAVGGQGLEVKEIRPYAPGDNPLSAVWSRFAQTGTLYSKVFQEERERTVYIAFDLSGSLFQGSGKRVSFGQELCALIVWAAIVSRDKVGAIMNRQKSIHVVSPKAGFSQLELLLQEIEHEETLPISSSLSSFFMKEKEAHGIKRSLLFYISDFIDPRADWRSLFLSLSLRHEVVLFRLKNDQEDDELLSAVGLPCFDPEGRGDIHIFTKSMARKRKEIIQEQQAKVEMAASLFRLSLFSLDVQQECLMQLVDSLMKRKRVR